MKQESFEWISRIIASCTNTFHFECAGKLLDSFKDRYGECEEWHELLRQLADKDTAITII